MWMINFMELQNIDYAYYNPPERNIIRIPEKKEEPKNGGSSSGSGSSGGGGGGGSGGDE